MTEFILHDKQVPLSLLMFTKRQPLKVNSIKLDRMVGLPVSPDGKGYKNKTLRVEKYEIREHERPRSRNQRIELINKTKQMISYRTHRFSSHDTQRDCFSQRRHSIKSRDQCRNRRNSNGQLSDLSKSVALNQNNNNNIFKDSFASVSLRLVSREFNEGHYQDAKNNQAIDNPELAKQYSIKPRCIKSRSGKQKPNTQILALDTGRLPTSQDKYRRFAERSRKFMAERHRRHAFQQSSSGNAYNFSSLGKRSTEMLQPW